MTATTLPRSHPANEPVIPTRVWRSLARREAGFTLRHPLIWVGVLASLYLLWSFNRGELPHLGGYSTYVGLGLAPLAGAALLVAHLQASRGYRNGTLEIEDPAPAQQRARTVGHLLGSLAVVPVAAVIVTAYMVYLYWLGGTGQPEIGELLVGPMVVGLAAVVGTAAGTWFPNRFSGFIGLGVLAAVQIALQDAPSTMHWFAWWHTVLWYGGFDLWIRPTWAHVAYLLGATTVIGAAAALRHGVRVTPIVVAAGGVALLVVSGATQAQLPSDIQVDQRFDLIANPASNWVTAERSGVTYNIHPSYERWVDWWESVISDTLAPIPAADRPVLAVEQWHHPYPSQIIDEFGWDHPKGQAIIERGNRPFFESVPADPWPIRVGDKLYLAQGAALVLAVAQRAVGLPLVPVEMEGPLYTEEQIAGFNDEPTDPTRFVSWPGRERGFPRPVMGDRIPLEVGCDAEGQAREVVAAWLAAQADPRLADRYRDIRLHGVSSDAIFEYSEDGETVISVVNWGQLGWMQHGGFGGGNGASAINGSPTATDLAAQLLEHPHATVASDIATNWNEWTKPTTPIQTIVDHFNLEPPPTPEQWIERGDRDPADFTVSIAAYPRLVFDELLGDQPYPICK
ncbi:MAG: hypothetical protein R2823_00085 [Acidimicrobiia bacterium]